MPEQPKNIKLAFLEALEKNTLEERKQYLDRICKENPGWRLELESLLKTHDEAGDFLESPLLDSSVTFDESPLSEGPGTKIGRYKLLELIGEGGFGMVYMAEQEKPIRRRVALKIIKLGMDTKQVIGRFEAERQALAMMDHINIAKVLDAGATETGRPYFVMELVKGIPITEYCDKNNLNTQQRLELFIEVCKAVQHAHQKGIIHRDIKPSNIMITLHDGKPVPKIIDFGIAKATFQRLTEKTVFTRYAQMIGTPEYMSPEQAEMSGLDVDTRTDIYSLGVLLYELLTGTTPFDAQTLREASYIEMQRIIRETEPPKPSTKLSTMTETLPDIAKHRQTNPASLSKLFRGDLDWIVMKALEKDRSQRYETASEFAQDILRHLSNEPVHASPPSYTYRIRKFVKKYRKTVAALFTIGVILTSGIVITTTLCFVAWQAQKDKTVALMEAQENERIANEATKEAVIQKSIAEEKTQQAQHQLAINQFESGIQLLNEGDELGMLDLVKAWENTEANSGFRESIGRLWAIAYDLSAGRLISILPGSPIQSISPNGKYLVTSSGRTAQLWEMETWQPHGLPLQLERNIDVVEFSPDSSLLVAHSKEGGISQLWHTTTGETVGSILRHDIDMLGGTTNYNYHPRNMTAFSPDGKLLAIGYPDGTVRFWDTATGQSYGEPIKHNQLGSIAFSPDDGKLIATGGDMRVQLWEVDTGQPYSPPMKTEEPPDHILFSPDGKLLATKIDQALRIFIWDIETGQLFRTLQHETWMRDIKFSPDDGKLLAASSWDWTALIWDIATGKLIGKTTPHNSPVDLVAFSSDGRLLAAYSSFDNTMRLWDVAAGEPYGSQLHCPGSLGELIFSPDDKFLISPGNGIWNTYQSLRTEVVKYQVGAEYGAISPDGKTGAIIFGNRNTVQLWNTATKQALGAPLKHEDRVTKVAFSPVSELLACSYGGFYQDFPGAPFGTYGKGYIQLWEVSTGQPFGPILETRYASSLVFSPNGELLADGTTSSTVDVFDITTWQRVRTFNCGGHVVAVAFSPDSEILATGINSGNVELWDMNTGEQIGPQLKHKSNVLSMAFSPDGNLLATVSGNEEQTVRIWDIGSDPPYKWLALPPLHMQGEDVLKDFSNNGTILVSRYGDNNALAWRLPEEPKDLLEIQLKTQIALGVQHNQQGEVISIQSSDWQRLHQVLAHNLQASKPRLVDISESLGSSEVMLTWTPGSDAVAHNVYFGTDPNKLELLGKVKEASLENVPELDMDKTYWWRIDTLKSDGSEVKGNLWTSLTGKMVGWWKFDETSGNIAHDSSGNGNHGTLEEALPPAPPIWGDTVGQKGGALHLDGVDDYVDCGNNDRLNITGKITLAAWVNTNDSGNGTYNPYVTKGDRSYAIQNNPRNEMEFVIYDDNYWVVVRYPIDSSFNGVWHHLAGTYDGSKLKLYIDGELKAITPYEGSITGSIFNVNIGRNSVITNRFYDGLIDDVAIFSRALDGTEITQLKNSGGASFIYDPNLEALWELDESSGDTAYDSSGNGIDGSLEPGSLLGQPVGDDSDGKIVNGPQWSDGRIEGALEFDGEDDFVSLPIGPLLSKLDRATIMLWVNFSNEGGFWQRIFDFGNNTTTNMFLTPKLSTNMVSDGPMRFAITTAGSGVAEQKATATDTLPSGWHHVAVTITTSGIISLYLDGSLVAENIAATLTPSDLGITTNNWLGRSQYSVNPYLKGSLDDFRIYNYALSPAEVAAIYAGEEPRSHEKQRWVVDISKEGYAPPELEQEKGVEYYVPLESEHDPKEQELFDLKKLDIACSVFSGWEGPEVMGFWALRGTIYANMEKWDKAIADYSKAIELDPNSSRGAYNRALAHLGMGDTGGYRERCIELIEYFEETDDPEDWVWMVWTCSLAPNAVDDFSRVIELAELAVKKGNEGIALGPILYRAGKFDEALQELSDLVAEWEQHNSMPTDTSPAYTWFFLAMAHHQLGNIDQSQRYFKLANEWTEENADDDLWTRRLTLQLLQAEARSLLGIPEDNSTNQEN